MSEKVGVMSSFRRMHRGGVAVLAAVLMVLAAAGTSSAATPGLSWTRIEPPAMADAIVRDAASNAGVLMAVGQVGLEAGIWRSRDAQHWSRVDVGEIGENTVLQSVTAWRQGFAAVGIRYTFASTGTQRDAVVMTSADGRHWRRADLPGGHGALPNAIAVHKGVLVTGGCLGVARFGCLFARDAQAVMWSSPDARAWARHLLPDGEHAFVNSIASVGGNLVLVGSEVNVGDSVFDSTPVAVAVWEGATAATERRVRDESLDLGRGNGVVSWRGTYLAVGLRDSCVESWKRDGLGWTTVDDPAALCNEEMIDAVAFHGAVYATGWNFSYERLPVWRTRDATHWTAVTDPALTSDGLMLEASAIIEWHGRLLIAGTEFSGAAPGGMIWLGTPGR